MLIRGQAITLTSFSCINPSSHRVASTALEVRWDPVTRPAYPVGPSWRLGFDMVELGSSDRTMHIHHQAAVRSNSAQCFHGASTVIIGSPKCGFLHDINAKIQRAF